MAPRCVRVATFTLLLISFAPLLGLFGPARVLAQCCACLGCAASGFSGFCVDDVASPNACGTLCDAAGCPNLVFDSNDTCAGGCDGQPELPTATPGAKTPTATPIPVCEKCSPTVTPKPGHGPLSLSPHSAPVAGCSKVPRTRMAHWAIFSRAWPYALTPPSRPTQSARPARRCLRPAHRLSPFRSAVNAA